MDPRQTQNGSWSGVHPPPSRAWVWVTAVVILLLGNAVAYRVWRSHRDTKAAAELAQKTAAEAQAAEAAADEEAGTDKKSAGAKKGSRAADEPGSDGALARARRVAGLAALEQGDYSRAVKELTHAARLGGAGTDVPELLKIARELEDRAAKQKRDAVVEAPKPVVAKAKPAPEPRRRSPAPKRRAEPVAAAEPAEEEAEEEKPGLLLVTSQPAGFVVEINGRRVDLTPARAELPAGMHRVVLIRGTKEVHARFVEVEPGQVASVDVDLTEELAPALPVAAAAPSTVSGGSAAQSDATGRDPTPSSSTATQRQAVTAAPTNTPAASSAQAAARTGAGEVYVTSPAMYGEVFINGRGYGFPPLLAKEVPAGPAVVELKVGGTTRRTMKVEVIPNRRLAARIR